MSAERVVFNIKGNDSRLVVAINYAFQVVLVKWLGTLQEYDQIDVESRGEKVDVPRLKSDVSERQGTSFTSANGV